MTMQSRSSSLKHYFDFLMAMTEKEIKARYKRAVMGFLWVILNPLLQMVIIGVVFSYFFKIENYYLFLFSGLLPWQFFSLSLTKTTPSYVYERNLLQKANFPRSVIPLSIILANFFHLIVSLTLLVITLIIVGHLNIINTLLLLPALVWLLLFTIGLSLLTASLNVRYRDINFFVQSGLILWFYATPILYQLSMIPQNIHQLFLINPLTSIFELFHTSLINSPIISKAFLPNLLVSLLIMVAGVYVYKKNHHYFTDWL